MKTLFVILIALGVVMVSGFAYARYQGLCNGPEGRADWLVKRIGNKLELDETQHQQLVHLRDRVMELRGDLRNDRPQHLEQALKLLEADRLDRDEANRLLQEKQAWVAVAGPQLIDAFGDFSDSLTEAQRTKLREMILQHRKRHHRGACCGDQSPALQE